MGGVIRLNVKFNIKGIIYGVIALVFVIGDLYSYQVCL